MRSNVTRRISRSLSASGAGVRSSASMRARTKRSIGLRGHAACLTSGAAAATGGRNDQCDCHSPPCSIHRLRTSISSGRERPAQRLRRHPLGLVLGGDPAIELALLEVPRHDGAAPDSVSAKAPSLVSNRSPALRLRASGPWHLKHLSDRIGRTWKLKSTFGEDRGSPPMATGRSGGRQPENGDQDGESSLWPR